MLAASVELLDHWGSMTAAPHYKDGLKDHEPVHIRRPGADAPDAAQENRVVTDPAEIARFFS